MIEILRIDIEHQPRERREQHQQRVEARKAQQPMHHFPWAGMDDAAREQPNQRRKRKFEGFDGDMQRNQCGRCAVHLHARPLAQRANGNGGVQTAAEQVSELGLAEVAAQGKEHNRHGEDAEDNICRI